MTALPWQQLSVSSSRLFPNSLDSCDISRPIALQRIIFLTRNSGAIFLVTYYSNVFWMQCRLELIGSSYCTVNRGDIYDFPPPFFFHLLHLVANKAIKNTTKIQAITLFRNQFHNPQWDPVPAMPALVTSHIQRPNAATISWTIFAYCHLAWGIRL